MGAHAGRKGGEGTWFAIPLSDGGWAVGVVARRARTLFLGYFFGPAWRVLPCIGDVAGLSRVDAKLIARVSDLGVQRGQWPILGVSSSWHRDDWPVPVFVRRDVLSGEISGVRYDGDNVEEEIECTEIPESTAGDAPDDGSFGHVALQIALSEMLDRERSVGVNVSGQLRRRDLARTRNNRTGGQEECSGNDERTLKNTTRNPIAKDIASIGSDVMLPCAIEHYLYFSDRTTAVEAKRVLGLRKFKVEVQHEPSDGTWLVLAAHRLTPASQEADTLLDWMEQFAKTMGGTYDGWEAEVRKE